MKPCRPVLHETRLNQSKALTTVVVTALLGCVCTLPARSQSLGPQTNSSDRVVSGSMLQTDGMLTKPGIRKMQRAHVLRRPRVANGDDTSGAWLIEYMSRLLDAEPAVARRTRTVKRVAVGTRAASATVPVKLTAAQIAGQIPPQQAAQGLPALSPPTSPIITGTVVPVRPDAGRAGSPIPSNEALIMAAERYQSRADLVKLEFAVRTYDERKLSGQQVFELRNDWRVLERARDALSGAELTSAVAAGFEANAYINDTTKTIVVAVAGSQDLRRDFLAADVWQALIKSEAPQQYFMAKTYVRSVIQRYQMQGFTTECVGHSLGGGACAYAAAELGIRAVVLNPIAAGKLAAGARYLVTNYVVDGDIANLIYGARGNDFPGDVQVINDGRDVIRLMALEKYGQLAGPILIVRELRASIDNHKADHALDLIAAQAETSRPR